MMITCDGYAIMYEKNMNRIIISLPQTMETITNTVSEMGVRKTDFTETDLAAILLAIKTVAEPPVRPELRMSKHGFRQWLVCG